MQAKYIMIHPKHVGLVALLLCATASFAQHGTFTPKAPDYRDDTMWVKADGDAAGTGADVFYVVSTW